MPAPRKPERTVTGRRVSLFMKRIYCKLVAFATFLQVIMGELSWTFGLLDSLRVTSGWYAGEAVYKGRFEFFWVWVIFPIDEYLKARVSAITGRAGVGLCLRN